MIAWPFVVAAYTVTAVLTATLLAWSWTSMRRAEAAAAALGER